MEVKRRTDWKIVTYNSFDEAEAAERRERMAMTGEERLRITETLRANYYGYTELGTEPRLERVIAVIPVA